MKGQIQALLFSLMMGGAVILGGIQADTSLNSSIRVGSNLLTDNQKACFSNIEKLTEAIKFYNEICEKEDRAESYDDKMLPVLIEGKYLLKELKPPTSRCEYASDGNLNKDGIIYCKFHGDLENKLGLWDKNKAKEDWKRDTNWPLIAVGVSLGFYLFINLGAWCLKPFFGKKLEQ